MPCLVCDSCDEAIEFYKRAIGAEEEMRIFLPDGRVGTALMKVSGPPFFLADDAPEVGKRMPRSPKKLRGTTATIALYVEDCDAVVQQAADAGATVVVPPAETHLGERWGMIQDPFGHSWGFATRIREMTPQEVQQKCVEMYAEM